MKKRIVFIVILIIVLVILPAFLTSVKPLPVPINKEQMLIII